jgi:formylmethanofuran dehydrogenase subunit C
MERMIVRERIETPSTTASKRFKGYKREPKRRTSQIEIEHDERLLRISNSLERYLARNEFHSSEELDTTSHFLIEDGLQCTAEEIERFSLSLAGWDVDWSRHSKVGFFLSALIKLSKDVTFNIHTDHLTGIDSLCMCNEKDVTVYGHGGDRLGLLMREGTVMVEGDVGCDLGELMIGGIVEVRGNAGGDVAKQLIGGRIVIQGDTGKNAGAFMKGGVVEVHGDADDAFGAAMEGGKLILRGNAKGYVGGFSRKDVEFMEYTIHAIYGSAPVVEYPRRGMEGGEIHVEGNIGPLGPYIRRGKIFHKEKLIVDK